MSETPSIVVPFTGRMTEVEYDRERTQLRATYGDNRSEAGIRWEQELAKLFFRSGWSQDHLAAKEGKKKSWVSQRLIFGRFLAYSENSTDSGKLTEWAFRRYWEQTDVSQTERQRFRAVERLIEEHPPEADRQGNATIAAIRRDYMDGKWHRAAKIAEDTGRPLDDVARALEAMNKRPSAKYKVERRGGRASYSYRFFKTEKPVSYEELVEKLTPLIHQLRSQAKTNIATVAISVFGKVAADLQRLLDEWGA